MHIEYEKNVGVSLTFNANELKFALVILKAIHKAIGEGEGFIKDAIDDIESDMRPKLTLISHYHYCSRCFCELDDRTSNAIHLTTDNDDKWVHRDCPELKPNRPE